MPKNIIEDIVIPKRFPPREIRVPIKERPAVVSSFSPVQPPPPPVDFSSKKRAPYGKVFFSIMLLLVASYVFLSMREGTTILVTPRSESVPISLTVPTTTYNEAGIPIEIVHDEKSLSREISVDGVKEIERRATGTIVVFNISGSKPQRLIARTRFETSDAKIYRIENSITVPGTTVKDGKTVPGSIEAKVIADEPGEAYNISFADFTIPGLRGTPLFKQVYARSKTEMTGGFVGPTKVLNEEEYTSAKRELESELTLQLTEAAKGLVSQDKILFSDAIFIDFTEEKKENVEKVDEPVTLILSGNLSGFTIVKNDLSAYLVKELLPEEPPEAISVQNLNELQVKIPSKDLIITESPKDVVFSVQGTGVFVWNIDKNAIAERLAGIPREDTDLFESIFRDYFPSVKKATVSRFSPFWKRSFPENQEKIKIIEEFEPLL